MQQKLHGSHKWDQRVRAGLPFLDNFPDGFRIDTYVVVDQDITHGGHVLPGDVRVFLANRSGNVLGGFAENFEAADDGVNRLSVGGEANGLGAANEMGCNFAAEATYRRPGNCRERSG